MPCSFTPAPIEGLVVVQPRVFPDDRGWFMETYKASEFKANGITEDFVQDNQSRSSKNVLRGLHFQRAPHAQGKLVRCLAGTIWDVAVDLRKGSSSFGQYFGIELSAENKTMLYIPVGFAHGFVTLSDVAEITYKCTAEYSPQADGGVRYNDPQIAVKWPIDINDASVSEKDAQLPTLADLGGDFAL